MRRPLQLRLVGAIRTDVRILRVLKGDGLRLVMGGVLPKSCPPAGPMGLLRPPGPS